MNVDGLVEAVSAAAGASVATGEFARRFWRRREVRQAAEFRQSVQLIVDESIADVIARQAEFERRQGRHLDRQDAAIGRIERTVGRLAGKAGT